MHISPQTANTSRSGATNAPRMTGDSAASPRRGISYPSNTVRIALIVIASIAVLWSLQWSADFLIPCTVAVCMTFWLMPLVDRLQALRIPRSLGAAIVLAALIGGIGFTGYMLRDDARGFAANLPIAAHRARLVLNEAAHDPNGIIHHVRGVFTDRISNSGSRGRQIPEVVTNSVDVQDVLLKGSSTAAVAAANAIVVLFAIYLMLLSGDLFKRKLMTVIGSRVETGVMSRKRMTVDILNEITVQFQRYLGVLAITNIAIGFMTWGAFAALGVEHAAVWGVAAAVLHIIPYLGPAIIAIASFLVTAVQFDSLGQATLVASTVLLIFCLIGMLFSTWLAGRASNMNSVAVFTGLMFWGWLWGISGLLLGTPLMMALKVVADRIDCLNWLGIFLGDASKRERKSHPAAEQQLATVSAVSGATPATAQAHIEGLADRAAMLLLSEPGSIAGEVTTESDVVAKAIGRDSRRSSEALPSEKGADEFGVHPLPA